MKLKNCLVIINNSEKNYPNIEPYFKTEFQTERLTQKQIENFDKAVLSEEYKREF